MIKQFYILFLLIVIPASVRAQSLEYERQFSAHKHIPFYRFKKKNNTHIFQGNRKVKNYFEGWYFKMVSSDEKSIISVIPGISLSDDGKKQHAFIQVINGITSETNYYTFPIEEFYFSTNKFAVRIGENYFSSDSISLNINQKENQIKGSIAISNQTPYKVGKRYPAIMGWYRFVPFMQCYHGVVSLTHSLAGQIKVNNNEINFEDGKGYVEKDWGESMPKAWIWMQSNHFKNSATSFMLSVATIPWLGKSFTGFLGFLSYDGKVQRFATYTKSNLDIELLSKNELQITIKNKNLRLAIHTTNRNSGILKAPVNGTMDRRIAESIDASMSISIFDKSDSLLYSDSSSITGLEMVGDIEKLLTSIK